MPSPIAHVSAAYLLCSVSSGTRVTVQARQFTKWRISFLVFAALSLLPDLDTLPGLLAGDLSRSHNTVMHSLIGGVVFALVVGACLVLLQNKGYMKWSLAVLACYDLHVIMDFFTIGRGVMLFWPFTSQRFVSPIPLFFGLHWSEGWFSPNHLWTIASELAFTMLVVLVTFGWKLWKTAHSRVSRVGSAD